MPTYNPAEHKPDPTLLDEIDVFADNCLFVTDAQRTVNILASASSHDPGASSAQPRIIVTAPKQSGKSTYMDVGLMLSDNGWMSNATQAGLRAFFNTEGNHTLFTDESQLYFGETGLRGQHLELYKVGVEGYRKRATLSFSVARTLTIVSDYGVAWFAGIGDCVPSPIMDRGIRIEMVPKPESVEKWDTLDDSVYASGLEYQSQLHEWVLSNHDYLEWFNKNRTRRLHPKMNARRRQIWGPLAAIAYAAGGTWPARFMEAFLALGLDTGKIRPTTNQQIVLDAAEIIKAHEPCAFLYTIDLVENLPERKIYEDWSEEYMLQALSRALGNTRQHLGTRLDGEHWRGKGRDCAQILEEAQKIQDHLWPEEPEVEDEIEDEMGGPIEGTIFPTALQVSGVSGVSGVLECKRRSARGAVQKRSREPVNRPEKKMNEQKMSADEAKQLLANEKALKLKIGNRYFT